MYKDFIENDSKLYIVVLVKQDINETNMYNEIDLLINVPSLSNLRIDCAIATIQAITKSINLKNTHSIEILIRNSINNI
jgi:hypothetical protein